MTDEYDIVLLDDSSIKNYHWEEILNHRKTLRLENPNPDLSVVPTIVIDQSEKYYFMPDPFSGFIHIYDLSGNHIRTIGGMGSGPGEFRIIRDIALGIDNSLWLYDPALKRISIFKYPDYDYYETILLDDTIYKMIMTSDSMFIGYTLHKEHIVNKYDKTGTVINRGYHHNNEWLRLFTARFQEGGITKSFNENLFYLIYPSEEFSIYEIDYDFNINKVIKSEKQTKFRPHIRNIPNHLSPYEYTEEHINWWKSFPHIIRLYTLEPNYIVVLMYEMITINTWVFYLNIYTCDGVSITEGLPIPENARIIGTLGSNLLVTYDIKSEDRVDLKVEFYEIKELR